MVKARWIATASCFLIAASMVPEAAAQGSPGERRSPPPERVEPVGLVTDPEVLAAAARWARERARAMGWVGPFDPTAYAAPGDGPEPTDPMFPFQWHLRNTGQDPCEPFGISCFQGTPGVDISAVGAWSRTLGEGMIVGIQEFGIEIGHPDLAASYDDGIGDGPGGGAAHGTPVAGVAAAVANNGLGGVGVAHGATITRIGFGNSGELPIEEHAEYLDVMTRSGSGFSHEAKEYLAVHGRDGLGTLNFQSAGNGRDQGWHTNISPSRSSRHGVVVASIGLYGGFSAFSNPGSSVFLAAPGEFVITPFVQGTGVDGGDYGGFFGTSASAPVAAGVGALVLATNPELGYRDAQEILALTARQTDPGNVDSWLWNGARRWNGGGFHTSHDYGFGLVDARAATRLAETWRKTSTAANEAVVSETSALAQVLPEGTTLADTVTFPSAGAIDIDFVEIRLDLSHVLATVDVPDEEEITDLNLTLVSPAGTESVILTPLSNLNAGIGIVLRADDPLPSTLHRGESSAGTWTFSIEDTGVDGVATTVNSWTLTLYGDPLTPDDTHVYTDEFAGFTGAGDADRRLLEDSAGDDVLNAAAVAGDMLLDLRPGGASSIAGNTLTLGTGTVIESAFAGDGDDQIVGGGVDNTLRGGRGDDILDGGDGRDVAVFGGPRSGYGLVIEEGDVTVFDTAPGVAGDEGSDSLTNIEVLRFADEEIELSAVIFFDGFESGDLSRWSAVAR